MQRTLLLASATASIAATTFGFGCSSSGASGTTDSLGGSPGSSLGGNTSTTSGILTGGAATTVATGEVGGGSWVSTGGTPGSTGTASQITRTFLMGSTPFFASATTFPEWRFENVDDHDLLSLHVDDFWGVPWDQCSSTGCQNLPTSWVAQWQDLASRAHATNRPIYLAFSPLGERKTLARRVLTDGTRQDHWLPNAALDTNGCYLFASDTSAARYKAAYIAYAKYIIDLVNPAYVSPAIEMNIPFTSCSSQKAAWQSWYTDVHNAVKAAYPSLVVFPTFQLENLYGVSDTQSACTGSTTVDQCFSQRLQEALTIPGDRIAFSSYPFNWKFSTATSFGYPNDTYSRVSAATSRRIWISETGWNSVPIRASYPHASSGSCGNILVPATFDAAGVGTIGIANDSEHAAYIAWLLSQAQAHNFEAVVWWLNRDFLDGASAATCPCAPSNSDTCTFADQFYAAGGETGELSLRLFANMGLRFFDGTPRPGYATWKEYLSRPLAR